MPKQKGKNKNWRKHKKHDNVNSEEDLLSKNEVASSSNIQQLSTPQKQQTVSEISIGNPQLKKSRESDAVKLVRKSKRIAERLVKVEIVCEKKEVKSDIYLLKPDKTLDLT